MVGIAPAVAAGVGGGVGASGLGAEAAADLDFAAPPGKKRGK